MINEDYSQIIRAARREIPTPPEWLTEGSAIASDRHGQGKVLALLGETLIAQFYQSSETIELNWMSAIANGELVPDVANVVQGQIDRIPHRNLREIATQLLSSIAELESFPPAPGDALPLPNLPEALADALKQAGITSMFSHQIEALEKLRAGLDVIVTTPTASGKTLCYNIAILADCCQQPNNTALYLFPLKALAIDQMGKLKDLVSGIPDNPVKIGLMTGDTLPKEREKLFFPNPPNILGVSPDLLHYYLFNGSKGAKGESWRCFLQNLKWVVVDESHTYIGSFGAHFANLMRRLRLAVDRAGGDSQKLQFVFSSATIGNPQSMALSFSGRKDNPDRLHLIDKSGSPTAGKSIFALKPSSNASNDAVQIALAILEAQMSGIIFCNSRSAVKNLLGRLQRECYRLSLPYAKKAAIFYGSLPQERRLQIVDRVKSGDIRLLISTSSLEAGIDLPELDCCLIRGFPGSLMSFWQRVGRAARRNYGGIFYLPIAQNPIDCYYAQGKALLQDKVENAAFNPDYPTILAKHLLCAAVESGIPLRSLTQYSGKESQKVAGALLEQKRIRLDSGQILRSWGCPHREINLRGTIGNTIDAVNADTGETIESLNLDLAYRELFPGAIYSVQDEDNLMAYQSEALCLDKRQALLTPLGSECSLFTAAEAFLNVQLKAELADHRLIATSIPDGKIRLRLWWAQVESSVTGYALLERIMTNTCLNFQCISFREPVSGRNCPQCGKGARMAEIVKVKDSYTFDKPYTSHYEAPCLTIELNPALQKVLGEEIERCKSIISQEYPDLNAIPRSLRCLWQSKPEAIALHSLQHQLVKAIPLSLLASPLDVQELVVKREDKIKGTIFDSTDGGNGATEAIFNQFEELALKASALSGSCNCERGCPKCLHVSSCPEGNEVLDRDLGMFLLESIKSKTASRSM
ncbi:DEAD/DEAH box helicase [Merismopedia glauca]|uniref:DEAD/DEAH box helicase n=1 Tax=Merismopedia glauca CCAP 1448/3 TaxID=1296344 RepID=A0A2T1BZQ0_9CYAN|nr:DEAD/DEAH box helicase [Merismopedia glauca]PSB01388.1 DEAD/DEAH box helicase [Merismopedia glauca CCAP 1448/3]